MTRRFVPFAGIGKMRVRNTFPRTHSSRPGSTPRRSTSSKTTRPFSRSTTLACRSLPSISRANDETVAPSGNGSTSSPSRTRGRSFWKTRSSVVAATPAATMTFAFARTTRSGSEDFSGSGLTRSAGGRRRAASVGLSLCADAPKIPSDATERRASVPDASFLMASRFRVARARPLASTPHGAPVFRVLRIEPTPREDPLRAARPRATDPRRLRRRPDPRGARRARALGPRRVRPREARALPRVAPSRAEEARAVRSLGGRALPARARTRSEDVLGSLAREPDARPRQARAPQGLPPALGLLRAQGPLV